MVTAAEGAEEFYNFSNEARYESVQEARIRDHSLRLAYLGHSNYKIVDNSSKDFEHKVKKTVNPCSVRDYVSLVRTVVLPAQGPPVKRILFTLG